MTIDPRPTMKGTFGVDAGGRLLDQSADGRVARYQLHVLACPVGRQRSRQRLLQEALAIQVAEAIQEGRQPPQPGQLSLLPPDRPPARAGWLRPGWIDLTIPYAACQRAPRRPWNGVVVIDLRKPPDPPRPN